VNEAIKLDASREDYYFQLGRILTDEKKYTEAQEAITKGMEIKVTPIGIRAQTNLLIATGENERALRILNQNKDHLRKYERYYGEILFNLGRHEQAIPYLTEALKQIQGPPYLLEEKLGKCYESMGELEQAEVFYIQSINKVEMNPRSQFYLAELYYSQQRYREAIPFYSFITEYWEYSRFSYERLADCYTNLNQPDKAARIMKAAPPMENQ
jgi:tetratricopeptide (TPR) repeat protein